MNGKNGSYHFILACPREQAMAFKQWCHTQGISMNKAIVFLMRKMVRKNYKLKLKYSLRCESKVKEAKRLVAERQG